MTDTDDTKKPSAKDWAKTLIIIALLMLAGFAVGWVARGHRQESDHRPGFYCNKTTAVYYDDKSFQTVPFAGECGGVG